MDKNKLGPGEIVRQQAPSTMIELAISQGSDLEKLEKLLELQERWEKNEARKEFHRAMAAFKKNPSRGLWAKPLSITMINNRTTATALINLGNSASFIIKCFGYDIIFSRGF